MADGLGGGAAAPGRLGLDLDADADDGTPSTGAGNDTPSGLGPAFTAAAASGRRSTTDSETSSRAASPGYRR